MHNNSSLASLQRIENYASYEGPTHTSIIQLLNSTYRSHNLGCCLWKSGCDSHCPSKDKQLWNSECGCLKHDFWWLLALSWKVSYCCLSTSRVSSTCFSHKRRSHSEYRCKARSIQSNHSQSSNTPTYDCWSCLWFVWSDKQSAFPGSAWAPWCGCQ